MLPTEYGISTLGNFLAEPHKRIPVCKQILLEIAGGAFPKLVKSIPFYLDIAKSSLNIFN